MKSLRLCLWTGWVSLFLTCSAIAAPPKWFDSSHSTFFPPSLAKKISVHQFYPVFWWNFIVVDIQDETRDWQMATKVCDSLKALPPETVIRSECQQNLGELRGVLQDWSQDYSRRHPRPSDSAILEKLHLALAKASLPAGDRNITSILQMDPLESWRELRELAENRLKISLERTRGFFYSAANHRIVIPVQLAFPPPETAKTRKFEELILAGPNVNLVGPHSSTIQNEEQIMRDMQRVSNVGIVVLVLFGAILVFTRRLRLLLLLPPVTLATGIGVLGTIVIFGSIHGLTLSFGTGIIGMALDYGLNGALNSRSPHTWKTNLFGLLTTLVGIFVLMMSSIPLLRQLMVFSAIGLLAAFGLFYALLRFWPGLLATEPLPLGPRPRAWKTVLTATLVLSSAFGLITLRPHLDMNQFNFQDPRTQEVSNWFLKSTNLKPPLFRIHESNDLLLSTHEEKTWSDAAHINFESAANYFPATEIQLANLKTWSDAGCTGITQHLSAMEQRFFQPFLQTQLCPTASLQAWNGNVPKSYLAHIRDSNGFGSSWISLWFPQSTEDEAAVRAKYPDAVSLRDMVAIFPQTLAHELSWMAPLALLLATALLVFYYRSLRHTLLALIPFFGGFGLVTLATYAFHFDTSFISVIGLVMVFGFSFDYGIFVTDIHVVRGGETPNGVWTALAFAAFTMVAGFTPLLFCQHPVLIHLGRTLFFGTLGTYFSAIWGIPGAASVMSKKWRKL